MSPSRSFYPSPSHSFKPSRPSHGSPESLCYSANPALWRRCVCGSSGRSLHSPDQPGRRPPHPHTPTQTHTHKARGNLKGVTVVRARSRDTPGGAPPRPSRAAPPRQRPMHARTIHRARSASRIIDQVPVPAGPDGFRPIRRSREALAGRARVICKPGAGHPLLSLFFAHCNHLNLVLDFGCSI